MESCLAVNTSWNICKDHQLIACPVPVKTIVPAEHGNTLGVRTLGVRKMRTGALAAHLAQPSEGPTAVHPTIKRVHTQSLGL